MLGRRSESKLQLVPCLGKLQFSELFIIIIFCLCVLLDVSARRRLQIKLVLFLQTALKPNYIVLSDPE